MVHALSSFQGFLDKSNEAYFNETKNMKNLQMQNLCETTYTVISFKCTDAVTNNGCKISLSNPWAKSLSITHSVLIHKQYFSSTSLTRQSVFFHGPQYIKFSIQRLRPDHELECRLSGPEDVTCTYKIGSTQLPHSHHTIQESSGINCYADPGLGGQIFLLLFPLSDVGECK